MTKLAASGFATALAIALVAGIGLASAPSSAMLSREALPIERSEDMSIGDCRITYDSLPQERQPAAMECEHAHWLAMNWGGRVMERTQDGIVEAADYEGDNDFSGVPAEALPAAGYCRAWVDGLSAETQPAQSDCRTARRLAAAANGRVLYMPL